MLVTEHFFGSGENGELHLLDRIGACNQVTENAMWLLDSC